MQHTTTASSRRGRPRRSRVTLGVDRTKGSDVMTYEAEKIKRLIDSLELCHHKAGRHVEVIIQAIGEGRTNKGYQGREPGRVHPATRMWQNAIDILTAWLSGSAARVDSLDVGGRSGRELLARLGERTHLKEWQVEQVINKLKAASRMYPGFEYHEMTEYPEQYRSWREFRDQTVAARIHDEKNGAVAEISLAAAIDHLEPCNWNFPQNLATVLEAINGKLSPVIPFAAHGRNVRLNPIGERMKIIAQTLRAFSGRPFAGEVDPSVLDALGERTPEKQAVATMLEEKISGVFERDAQQGAPADD